LHSFWVQAVFGCAWGLAISWAMIRWVAPFGWMDHPEKKRKHHAHPTPRTAGMVLWVGLIAVQVAGMNPFGLHRLDWLGIHAMALTGMLDDRFNLRPRYKAVVGLLVANILAMHTAQLLGGSQTQVTFLGLALPTHPALITPILLLWFWAVPQAYNLIDGINGLSIGFAGLLLGVLGGNFGHQPALLWGVLVAVFFMNFPKARHFLGDCGALLLGTFFAILGVKAFAFSRPDLMLWVFAYPIVDVSLVVCIRRWKGHPLGQADRSHMHHWMMERLHGRVGLITPILLGLAALPMLRATWLPEGHLISILGLAALLGLALKVFMDRTTKPGKAKEGIPVRRDISLMGAKELRHPSGSHPRV
jgi:UDP-GlcNAc:undecaprenyl-phosphate GlcNAc-1-phosphate transferase